ncbi:MAG: aminomethyl-transferring glycine dehydrogenase subunit GcvPB [Candidatus Gastranaerophilales bacterium]|nr:aminomethyl-transferring glycine dehydrogenase subunit GcvPB [Candidatus Gastranaerophilales bacterium]
MSKTIFEKSIKGTQGINLTDEKLNCDILLNIPENLLRKEKPILPEISELEVVRHFTLLSQKNVSVDSNFYPLGSCTMKYNPKINEVTASLDGFANIHPEQEESGTQGALELMYNLPEQLKEITGMHTITLQPAAGAHGEFTGMLIVKAYFEKIGQKRTKVIVPDSAHGTNPTSAKMCGFDIVEIKSNNRGLVDLEALKTALSDDVAALLLTNPNTLGLFEEDIAEIAKLVHDTGALLYYDGANLNAIMGITNPGLMGFDIVHINLHKTFSTPHGGGGPGAGPVGVVEKLKDFLPVPIIEFKDEKYHFNYDLPNTIGRVKAYYGNFGVLVRAYTYILMMGANGLKQASIDAVLNANYMKEKLKKYFKLEYDKPCMHEFVLSGDIQKEQGANTLAIAKRLIDYGFHPPTVYFPLIVHEAIMIEPTETESKQAMDDFINAMVEIAEEIKQNPQKAIDAPTKASVLRVDETLAARKPNLHWS